MKVVISEFTLVFASSWLLPSAGLGPQHCKEPLFYSVLGRQSIERVPTCWGPSLQHMNLGGTSDHCVLLNEAGWQHCTVSTLSLELRTQPLSTGTLTAGLKSQLLCACHSMRIDPLLGTFRSLLAKQITPLATKTCEWYRRLWGVRPQEHLIPGHHSLHP